MLTKTLLLFLVNLCFWRSQASMESEIKAIIDKNADETNYGISFAYKDADGHFDYSNGARTFSRDFEAQIPGNVTWNDTLVIGSGTKPFIAAGIMRLVD